MAGIMGDAYGVGLAAPQLGISQRLLVYRVGPDAPLVALANPELEWHSNDEEVLDEGCLSIPGITVDVERPVYVRVRALDEEGETRLVEASGLEARVIQHEMDHLNGVLILDRTSRDERKRALRELREAERAREERPPAKKRPSARRVERHPSLDDRFDPAIRIVDVRPGLDGAGATRRCAASPMRSARSPCAWITWARPPCRASRRSRSSTCSCPSRAIEPRRALPPAARAARLPVRPRPRVPRLPPLRAARRAPTHPPPARVRIRKRARAAPPGRPRLPPKPPRRGRELRGTERQARGGSSRRPARVHRRKRGVHGLARGPRARLGPPIRTPFGYLGASAEALGRRWWGIVAFFAPNPDHREVRGVRPPLSRVVRTVRSAAVPALPHGGRAVRRSHGAVNRARSPRSGSSPAAEPSPLCFSKGRTPSWPPWRPEPSTGSRVRLARR